MTTLDVPDGTVLEVDQLLGEGRMIAAIKAVRDATLCSLIDARNWVYYRAGGVSGQPPAVLVETTTTGQAPGQQAVNCDMTGPHWRTPAPAVVATPGGTRLCGECAVTMLRHALATRREFRVGPLAVIP